MAIDQFSLFGGEPAAPEGFRYQSNVIAPNEEQTLVDQIRQLPLENFRFQGYVGNRRVVSYGWRYDHTDQTLNEAGDIPPFLLAVRESAACFARIDPSRLQQALVTEYDAGAGIGWHRDKAIYGEIVGISLLSSCVFRLRRQNGEKWDRFSLTAEPRSAYLMSGSSRTEWEHSIPEVAALRYSITFRNLR